MDNTLPVSTAICKYEPIVVSDHAATSVNIHFQKFNNSQPSLRLDTQLLLDKDFIRFVAERLEFYFQINKTQGITAAVLWEAMKAFISGENISYNTIQKRQGKKK